MKAIQNFIEHFSFTYHLIVEHGIFTNDT